MRQWFRHRSIIEKTMMLRASMIVALVFVVVTGGCSSSSNPNNPSPTPTPSPTLPNVAGTWTLVMTTTTPVRPYSTYTVTLVQNGTILTGSILPVGTTRPTPISLGSVSTSGDVVFGSEHAWWNDVGDTVGSDLYVHLTLDSTGNRMTGSCPSNACGVVTATRTVTPTPTPSPTGSSMSAKIDGVAWSGTGGVTAIHGSGLFSIGAANNSGVTLGVATIASGPGTYTVGTSATNSNLMMFAGGALRSWKAGVAGGSGSITFTTLTATGASGTFFFTLVPDVATGATGNKSVTEGVFNVTF
jgi:hypothetical protein